MAMTREDNEILTRVEKGAPMGEMIRQHYWLPAIPSRKIVADGAPVRIRLLGTDLIAFRTTDGRAGVVDERCPHRGASLALAHNRNNSLRCIYHGWTLNVAGEVIAAPNQVSNQEQFCKSVRINRYKVEERGGIVWVWLGTADDVPRFPDLPFTSLASDQIAVTSQQVPTNWVQGVEASMDSSHVGILHESTAQVHSAGTQRVMMSKALAPRFEFEDRPYGYRYAAIRPLDEKQMYVRINNFVMPWYGVICAPEKDGPATVFFSVPVDDVTHRAWFVHFNPSRPLGMTNFSATPDVWNYPPLPPGAPEDNWGQNRDLMQRGHASGFPQHLGTEDFAMFISQGPIADRTQEQLCSADAAVVRLRWMLLKSVKEFQAGQKPKFAHAPDLDYSKAVSVGGLLPATADWRSLADGA